MAAPASAGESSPDWTDFRQWLSSYDVSENVQDALVSELDSGAMIDSMISGEVPVSTRTIVTESATESVGTFEDGSIVVGGIEMPVEASGGVGPMAIADCSISSGGGYAVYTNCRIYQTNGLQELQFYANYQRYIGGAQITAAWGQTAVAHYGSVTPPTLSIIRGSQNGSLPALATEHTHFTSWDGLSSEDWYLSLRVNATMAWTTTY